MPVRRRRRRDPGSAGGEELPHLARLPARGQSGQRYGFRLDGPYDPAAGQLHNPAKLLIDPYARAIEGDFVDDVACYPGNGLDSAPFVPRSVVVVDAFPWGNDPRPNTAWEDTIIYELHVRGFTARHPDIPADLRGTYAGLAHPAAISYLKELGITAVELLPIHHFVSEPALQRRGRRTTGATTRSASSPRTPPTPPTPAGSAATRCASSRRWCGRCTPPASR